MLKLTCSTLSISLKESFYSLDFKVLEQCVSGPLSLRRTGTHQPLPSQKRIHWISEAWKGPVLDRIMAPERCPCPTPWNLTMCFPLSKRNFTGEIKGFKGSILDYQGGMYIITGVFIWRGGRKIRARVDVTSEADIRVIRRRSYKPRNASGY